MTRDATARLFIAVDPPAEVREGLLAWARAATARLPIRTGRGALASMRLLEPEALHVTLCFLGGRPVGEIAEIAAVLSGCATRVGELSLGAPLWLPPRRPRALAVEVHDRDGGLTRLHGVLRGALADATGWQAERRRFKAHITVARMRGRGAPPRPAGPARLRPGGAQAEEPVLPATPSLSFRPEAVVLYRSWLSPAGASYQPLATCDLLAAER
jgi:RNA 2',3'-cyclic 3'-phosphodiesterase